MHSDMKQFINLVQIFFLATALVSKVCAQSPPALPTIMPPPADAASLGKYADIPVNMSTGIPNISVPIYNIKTPRLEVPINLSYYASGIKVDDIASWVGLGWSLNAGGAITRTIK